MVYYVTFLGIAFLITSLFVSFSRFLGKHYDFVPESTKGLPAHWKNVPYLGGLGLFLGFLSVLCIFSFWKMEDFEFTFSLASNKLLGILLGTILVCFIGFVHDIHPMPLWLRLGTQTIAAFLLALSGVRTGITFLDVGPISLGESLPQTGQLYLGNIFLTIIWVLVVVNIMNILEIFDGLIVSIGIIAGLFLFVISILGTDYAGAFLSISFVGVLAGILWNQIQPTNILLGKMGTGFVGFLLAVLTLQARYSQNNIISIVIPFMILAVPFIVFAAIFLRKLLGKATAVSAQELYSTFVDSNVKDSGMLTMGVVLSTISGLISIIVFLLISTEIALGFFILFIVLMFVAIAKIIGYKGKGIQI